MSEEELLVNLLNKQLIKIQIELEVSEHFKDDILEEYQELIDSLKRDKNVLVKIDLDDIDRILTELRVEEKDEIMNYFEVIQKLLRLNHEVHTTYKLTESQLEYINLFLKKVDSYEKERWKKYQEKVSCQKKYQQLLDKFIHKKEPITELDTLKNLFIEQDVEDDKQSRLFIFLMKYNKSLSDYQESILPSWDAE